MLAYWLVASCDSRLCSAFSSSVVRVVREALVELVGVAVVWAVVLDAALEAVVEAAPSAGAVALLAPPALWDCGDETLSKADRAFKRSVRSAVRVVEDAAVLDAVPPAPVAAVVVLAAVVEAPAVAEVEPPPVASASWVNSPEISDSTLVRLASRAARLEAEPLVSVVVAVVLAAVEEADWLDSKEDKVLLENCEDTLDDGGGGGGGGASSAEAALSAAFVAAPCTSVFVDVAAVLAAPAVAFR